MTTAELVHAVVGLFAAIGALLTVGLNLTRSTRLRQKERVLRDAAGSTSSPTQAATLESIRQTVVADIVAQHLIPNRRYLLTSTYHLLLLTLVTLSSYALSSRSGQGDAWMGRELLLAFQSGSALYILCIVAGLALSTFLTATLWSLQEQRARVRLAYIEGKEQIHGRQPGDKISTSTSGWVAGTALASGTALVGASWGHMLWAAQQSVTPTDNSIAMAMAMLGAVGLVMVFLVLMFLTGSRGPQVPATHPFLHTPQSTARTQPRSWAGQLWRSLWNAAIG